MKANINPMWNRLHLVVELLIVIGFSLSLIPFLYLWVAGWIIPVTIISVIFSFVLGNRTLPMTIANVVMSILSFIPIIGYIPRIIGLIISIINMVNISRSNHSY